MQLEIFVQNWGTRSINKRMLSASQPAGHSFQYVRPQVVLQEEHILRRSKKRQSDLSDICILTMYYFYSLVKTVVWIDRATPKLQMPQHLTVFIAVVFFQKIFFVLVKSSKVRLRKSSRRCLNRNPRSVLHPCWMFAFKQR